MTPSDLGNHIQTRDSCGNPNQCGRSLLHYLFRYWRLIRICDSNEQGTLALYTRDVPATRTANRTHDPKSLFKSSSVTLCAQLIKHHIMKAYGEVNV